MTRLLLGLLLLLPYASSKRGQRINIFSQKDGRGDITQIQKSSGAGVMMNALKRNSPFRWNKQKDNEGYNVIPYVITGIFQQDEQKIIKDAMDRIAYNTCIRFKRRENEQDYVEIQNQMNEGCYTSVGRTPGRNIVMLEANAMATCVEPDIVIHELFHSIGLWHEHMRYDRDDYITVHTQNIPEDYRSQFEKVSRNEATTYDIPYDYRSVMHYAEDAFAKQGKISMETKDPKYQRIIGHVEDAAPTDYGKICILYECRQCMGQPFEEMAFLRRYATSPAPLPNGNSVIEEEGFRKEDPFRKLKDDPPACFDIHTPVCSMISSGNFFLSCSGLTRFMCCQTCRDMQIRNLNTINL